MKHSMRDRTSGTTATKAHPGRYLRCNQNNTFKSKNQGSTLVEVWWKFAQTWIGGSLDDPLLLQFDSSLQETGSADLGMIQF